MDTMDAKGKRQARIKHLASHPKECIHIDIEELRQIADFDMFLCHPKSSVACGVAINGSDIDAGLVVFEKPVLLERELQFIAALRKRGFNCYHPSELTGELSIEERVRVENGLIRFRTHDEILALKEANHMGSQEVLIYYAGYRIGGDGEPREDNWREGYFSGMPGLGKLLRDLGAKALGLEGMEIAVPGMHADPEIVREATRIRDEQRVRRMQERYVALKTEQCEQSGITSTITNAGATLAGANVESRETDTPQPPPKQQKVKPPEKPAAEKKLPKPRRPDRLPPI